VGFLGTIQPYRTGPKVGLVSGKIQKGSEEGLPRVEKVKRYPPQPLPSRRRRSEKKKGVTLSKHRGYAKGRG